MVDTSHLKYYFTRLDMAYEIVEQELDNVFTVLVDTVDGLMDDTDTVKHKALLTHLKTYRSALRAKRDSLK